MKRYICLVFLIIFISAEGSSQFRAMKFQKDTLKEFNLIKPEKKRPWRALAEMLFVNVGVNRYDAWPFLADQWWARVTPESWADNLKHGFEWDWNSFGTNWFAHPYHGSLYYNSARTNGLNFWESIPYTFAGSFTWEYFGETHPPSGNDLFSTTLGGIYLGEMFYRISGLILDDRKRGRNRTGREIGAFLINPMGGFNRLIDGEMNDHYDEVNQLRKPANIYLSLGSNLGFTSLNDNKENLGPILEFGMEYGHPFGEKKKYKPFDYFKLRFWLRKFATDDIDATYFNVLSSAMIWGKNVNIKETRSDIIGVFQHYDYIQNPAIEIGAVSFSLGWMRDIYPSENWHIRLEAQVGGALLGGSNSEVAVLDLPDDFDDDLKREYILGPGIMGKSSFTIEHKKYGRLTATGNTWSLFVTSGPNGSENLDFVTARYSLPIWNRIDIAAEFAFYNRLAKYNDVPGFERFEQNFHEFRSVVSYNF